MTHLQAPSDRSNEIKTRLSHNQTLHQLNSWEITLKFMFFFFQIQYKSQKGTGWGLKSNLDFSFHLIFLTFRMRNEFFLFFLQKYRVKTQTEMASEKVSSNISH